MARDSVKLRRQNEPWTTCMMYMTELGWFERLRRRSPSSLEDARLAMLARTVPESLTGGQLGAVLSDDPSDDCDTVLG